MLGGSAMVSIKRCVYLIGLVFLLLPFCAVAQETGGSADLLVKSAGIVSDKYLMPMPKDFLLQSGLLRMKGTLVNPELAQQVGITIFGGGGQGFVQPQFGVEPRPALDPVKAQQLLKKIDEVYARIKQKPEAIGKDYQAWLDEIFTLNGALTVAPENALARAALTGMLAEVNGRLEQGEKAYVRMERYARQYGNLGLNIDAEDGQFIIRHFNSGSGLTQADIRQGDILLKIGGKETKGRDLGAVWDMLRGAPGTKVVITVRHEGEQKLVDVTLTRSTRNPWNSGVRNKFASPESKIGYVRCWNLPEGRVGDMDEAVQEMAQQGMAGLIVDLRVGNIDSFDSAADLVDRLVAGQWSLVYDSRSGVQKETRAAKQGAAYPDVPLVVLVDRQTNGPQELVAAVVQATGRGLVLGDTTAGRALGQQEFSVPGHDYRLRFASAIYRTPKGDEFQGKGITPDIRVEMDPNDRGRIINQMQMEDYGQQASYYGRGRHRHGEDELHDVQLEKAIEYLGGTAAEAGKKTEEKGREEKRK
jgi:carboxyl-terminal processing protease